MISNKVSPKELRSITEYANQCGETISQLIRKSIISKAVLAQEGGIPLGYELDKFPDGEEEDYYKTFFEKINKIRRIL